MAGLLDDFADYMVKQSIDRTDPKKKIAAENSLIGAVGENIGGLLSNPIQQFSRAVGVLMQPADEASAVSHKQFPNQDWDNTQRNALRHAMWIGGMARAMGASPDNPIRTPIAKSLAKGVGYANEAASYLMRLKDGKPTDEPSYVSDTLHDLNNNAVGADVAGKAASDEEFKKLLIANAMSAQIREPAGLLSPSNGRLSFDPNTPVSRWQVPR